MVVFYFSFIYIVGFILLSVHCLLDIWSYFFTVFVQYDLNYKSNIMICFRQSWVFIKRERLQSQLEEWSGLPGDPVCSAAWPGGPVQSQNQKQQAEPGGGLPHRRERAEDPQTAGSWWWVIQLYFAQPGNINSSLQFVTLMLTKHFNSPQNRLTWISHVFPLFY